MVGQSQHSSGCSISKVMYYFKVSTKKKPSSMMPKQTKYELPPFTWWLMHTNYPLHVQVQGVTFAREVKI